MDKTMELAQMLARFKLQVKRALGESVDLERLSRDVNYARQRLSEIEELAQEEELLIMVLRIRDLIIPADAYALHDAANAPKETRNYLMGARAW